MFYKVKWKGYRPHKWSWETENHVTHAKDLVEKFHQQNPMKSKPHHARNQKIKIPMNLFPRELFCPLPESLTELTPRNQPTESMVHRFAQIGVRALERG